MIVVVISGAPGSGKTTQADLLKKDFKFVHVSTGILLRNEIVSDSELGKIAKECISDGNFISDEIACKMVKNVIIANPTLKAFVFDGFPRTLAQCIEFDNILADFNAKVNIFIDLHVPESELLSRLISRSSVSDRKDDSDINIIRHRFELYNDMSVSINEFYKSKGVYSVIDGNKTKDLVFSEIKSILDNNLNF